MDRRTPPSAVLALAATLLLPLAAAAQDGEAIPEWDYGEKAAAAENAPLFLSTEPLKLTLRTDIEWLRDERNDSIEVDGVLTIFAEDGTSIDKPVEVRARGNFRREKRNCNFPPLRLDVPTKQMKGTVFEGQDKLKLVTPCHDGRSGYQKYVLQEYLVYQAFQVLSPAGFRVRLVEITYEDIEDDYDTRTKFGFLIEDEDRMAERNHATLQEWDQFHPASTDSEQSVLVAMFNYMIANTDWSPVYFHNVKLIRTEDARYLTVPYDFDFSGIVSARYATPDASLPIRDVRDRLFRGFCRDELDFEQVSAFFDSKRPEIWSLYEGFTLLEEDDLEDSLKFIARFYDIVDDERKFERQVRRACRNW